MKYIASNILALFNDRCGKNSRTQEIPIVQKNCNDKFV